MKKFIVALVGGFLLSFASMLIMFAIEVLWEGTSLANDLDGAFKISMLSSMVFFCVGILTVFFVEVKEFLK
jgi:hypothetical protein